MTSMKLKFLTLINFFIVVLIASLEMLIPLLEGKFIESIAPNGSIGYLLWVTVLCIVVNAFLYFVLNKLVVKNQNSIISNISTKTLRNVTSFCQSDIKKNAAGYYTSFLERAPVEIAQLASPVFLFFIFYSIIAFFAIVITIKWTHSFLIIFPVALFFYLLLDKLFERRLNRMAEKISNLSYDNDPKFIDYIKNAKTISRFGNTRSYLKKFDDFQTENYYSSKRFLLAKEMKNGLTELVSTTSFVILICILCFDIMYGRITFARMVIILAYFNIIMSPISYLNSYRMILVDTEYSRNLYKKIRNNYNAQLSKKTSLNLTSENSIKVQELSFSYTQDMTDNMEEQMDYENISFTISKGERLSLIGLSGEGKSTIIKLLLGELEPKSGVIEIAGINISMLPQQVLNYLICVYEQQTTIFPMDIYENICLGRKMVSNNEIQLIFESYKKEFSEMLDRKTISNSLYEVFDISKDCSKEENLFLTGIISSDVSPDLLASILLEKKFISIEKVEYLIDRLGLTHLKNRNLGTDGSNISGGEKERVSMARFLTKEKALLYLIDEPFTSLDAKTEAECLQLLNAETEGKTIFVISHKFNIIKALSNKCIVLQNGKISQQGTHDKLIVQDGLYKELAEYFNAQHGN